MPRQFVLIRLLLLLVALGWWQPVYAWSFLKDKSGTHVPAVGKLLVAMPGLNSPHFNTTVILLLRYSATGAAGVIINRPTQITLALEFDDQVSASQRDELLFWGGPVAMDKRVLLLESFDQKDTAPLEKVFDSIYLANERSEFRRLLKQDQPRRRFRVFAGYAGWGASQLEREIVRGDWLVLPGSAELVMQGETGSIWPQLMHYQHGQMATLELSPPRVSPLLAASFP